MEVHKYGKEEARIAAKIQKSTVKNPPPLKPSPVCSYCGRRYARRRQLFAHLMSQHGKTEDEAKEMTQFRTTGTLNLVAGSG